MLTPIDYATKDNHEEAIQVLQAALESARSEKLSETSSEMPSEKPPEQEGGPKPIYHVGDEFEVFSNSLGKWFKGRVEKVLAGTVRVMFSDDTGAPHYKELEETNQDLRVLKARTEEEAIAEAAKLGFVVGGQQRFTVISTKHGCLRKLKGCTTAWCMWVMNLMGKLITRNYLSDIVICACLTPTNKTQSPTR